MSKKEGKKGKSFLGDFLLGGVAATVSKTSAAPIERIKLLLQNQDEMLKSGRLDRPYKGAMDCFNRVLQAEGLLSLWRGNLPNVLRYFPAQAINFGFKDYFRCLFGYSEEKDGHLKTFSGNVASGAMAGVFSLLFVYSLDYARTRLANDGKKGGERQFRGMLDVYGKSYGSDGIVGLYRGFVVSCLGIAVYRGLYFGLFDSLKPLVLTGPLKNSFVGSFFLGWGITITAGLASYPIDTIRRRLMMTSGEAVKYKSSMHCFTEIVKKEGWQSLFKGASVNIIRGIAGATALAGYDKFQILFFGKTYGSGGSKLQLKLKS